MFPPVSKLDPAVYGPPESAIREEHIVGHLEGMSVQQVCYYVQTRLLHLLYSTSPTLVINGDRCSLLMLYLFLP